MALTSPKTENELILRRRKRKRIKKILMLFILLLSICITLCLKHPYFNIKNIEVSGNRNISSKEIVDLSRLFKGNNIFYINVRNGENNILSNPYISEVQIKRKLPATVQINIKEREALFYNAKDNKYFIVDKNGVVLQKKDDIKGMHLVKLDGFDYDKSEIGKVLKNDDKSKIDIVTNLGNIILNSKNTIGVTYIDLNSTIDIKIYFGDMCVKLGRSDNLDKKVNEALNIINSKGLKGAKGYIDVSFDGNPVFFIQK
ncbi:cell division protein FtsQ [Clostridium carboxidivorans P7]|uniref:Polypeptide-transport-associated domain protein FtsQ-type n=1 Tax=Clostridium carboxidivorans P7 TaxID=536227 RepID=C6Q0P5_9CLOT|nr:FtsQ-type POTRA domain-containing protein [Clostridium carboxidivorans]AKN33986.1 cell division protein FtsQ [Clostridium carboxidivorans P7]EET84933.1 Polypeptide-transport-associated domain protein FtsQ-type [Clostridium carboxidivorans P7]EFG87782.1 POTRA domain-containing protein, FtsQ-type [Clostridium carboxidivorans P7]EFG88140.1 POTRA domain-containing protein, FtsQ-type [Clostridium carboxidivorans P7]